MPFWRAPRCTSATRSRRSFSQACERGRRPTCGRRARGWSPAPCRPRLTGWRPGRDAAAWDARRRRAACSRPLVHSRYRLADRTAPQRNVCVNLLQQRLKFGIPAGEFGAQRIRIAGCRPRLLHFSPSAGTKPTKLISVPARTGNTRKCFPVPSHICQQVVRPLRNLLVRNEAAIGDRVAEHWLATEDKQTAAIRNGYRPPRRQRRLRPLRHWRTCTRATSPFLRKPVQRWPV